MPETAQSGHTDTDWKDRYVELRVHRANLLRTARSMGQRATALALEASAGQDEAGELDLLRSVVEAQGCQAGFSLQHLIDEIAAMYGCEAHVAKSRAFQLLDRGDLVLNSDFTVRFAEADNSA